jgi:flagellar basal body P-ring protein FlgI
MYDIFENPLIKIAEKELKSPTITQFEKTAAGYRLRLAAKDMKTAKKIASMINFFSKHPQTAIVVRDAATIGLAKSRKR